MNEIDGIIFVEIPKDHPGTIVDAILDCGHHVKFIGSNAYRGLREESNPSAFVRSRSRRKASDE